MFSVRWVRSALDELANIWLQAESSERQAITSATDQIDKLLQSNPASCGESRSGDRRILLVPTLGVTFKVQSQDRFALVLTVWRFGKRQ